MEELLNPPEPMKKVQSNIQKFESLTPQGPDTRKQSKTLKSTPFRPKTSILEIDGLENEETVLKESKPLTVAQELTARIIEGKDVRKRKPQDSKAFHEQTYLNGLSSSLLSDNAREILKSQPSHDDLLAVLQYLQFGVEGRHEFNLRVTGPKAAQIINVLVTVTIPDIWVNMKPEKLSEDEARMKKTVISSLTSAAGIGALLAQTRQMSSLSSNENVLFDTIMVLGDILKGHKTVYGFIKDVQTLYEKELDRRLFWQEISALLAGSKVLSTVAQALAARHISNERLDSYMWLADGGEYTKWLAKNILYAATKLSASAEASWKCVGQLVKRGMSIGHRDIFVAEIYTKLLLDQRALWTPLHLILTNLSPNEQQIFFDSVLSDFAQKHLASTGAPNITCSDDPAIRKLVAGAAALIAGIVKNNAFLEERLEEWLTGGRGVNVSIGILARRALIAIFGHSEGKLQRILERSLTNFGDKLQIQHSSIMQQEATAQIILLIVGCLNRIDVKLLKAPSMSTLLMQVVSSRLTASIPRSRLLGMIVGTAVSRLVDKQDDVIDFGSEEMEHDDVQMWLRLTTIHDRIGDLTDICGSQKSPVGSDYATKQRRSTHKEVRRKALPTTSKVIAIEEISTSSDSENDLVPYRKPDSDPEDSEDDPTLIDRNKPSAPVYIVDLVKQLQTTDKPEIVFLALQTASSLIRRKAEFGTEVSDNVLLLTTVLINLQEGMSESNFQQLRLDSLVACIVARADVVGPSLANVYFQGDFSLSQRIAILTALGLAARELAGFNDDQKTTTKADTFPSKRLPSHLEPERRLQHSPTTSNPIAILNETAAHNTIRPMALAAADKVTGPAALKIRTFSSRMEIEKRNQAKSAARTRAIPKNLYKLLTHSIYLPLCSRMSLLLSYSIGGQLPQTSMLHSSTIRLFLQTLTLVLHTLGPSASMYLPTLTHETLLLLIALHSIQHIAADPAVVPAILHLLLALLDVTIEAGTSPQERLITDHGPQMTELVSWSNSLRDRTNMTDAEPGDGGLPWTVLAAGIQVKWFEVGRRFQSRMLGLTVDEMDQLAGT